VLRTMITDTPFETEMGFAGAPLWRVGAGPAREMALHQEHARRAQVRGRSRRRPSPSTGNGERVLLQMATEGAALRASRAYMKHVLESLKEQHRQISKETQTMRIETRSRTRKLATETSRILSTSTRRTRNACRRSSPCSSAAFEALFQRYRQKCFMSPSAGSRIPRMPKTPFSTTFQQAFVHLKSFQGQSRFPLAYPHRHQ